MTADVLLVIGIILMILAFPTLLSSFSSGAPLTRVMALVAIGGALIVGAFALKPGGYTFNEIPDVFARVIGSLV